MKIFYYLFLYLLILETVASQVVPYLQIPVINKNDATIIHINDEASSSIRGLSKIIQSERSQYIFNLKVNKGRNARVNKNK